MARRGWFFRPIRNPLAQAAWLMVGGLAGVALAYGLFELATRIAG